MELSFTGWPGAHNLKVAAREQSRAPLTPALPVPCSLQLARCLHLCVVCVSLSLGAGVTGLTATAEGAPLNTQQAVLLEAPSRKAPK